MVDTRCVYVCAWKWRKQQEGERDRHGANVQDVVRILNSESESKSKSLLDNYRET